jgi:hypothetical protein
MSRVQISLGALSNYLKNEKLEIQREIIFTEGFL